jgi:hypothetical protein
LAQVEQVAQPQQQQAQAPFLAQFQQAVAVILKMEMV